MKKLIQAIFSVTAVLLLLNSCKQDKDNAGVLQSINTNGAEAKNPYYTRDNHGNPVLCWTEKNSTDSLYQLKYATYNADADSFSVPVAIPVSRGVGTSAESMGKVAFKSDGTIVAVFSKRFENEKNPFAGAIYYSMSGDNGKSWSAARFLHSDTSHAYGRGFYDLTTLQDGELAAVWIDGRYGKEIKGSSLFYARTQKGAGFGADTCLDKGICECCRTDIVSDQDGNIHIAYRSIMLPSGLMARQVRDMVYIVSKDMGQTFSSPKAISNDNWEIDGCPHSGPTLAVTNAAVNAVWFTAGGSAGLYYTYSPALGQEFNRRSLVSADGRHPQLIAMPDGKLAMVCEESDQAVAEPAMKMDHSKGMAMNHAPAAASKIILRVLDKGKEERNIALTDGHQPDHHAVILALDNTALIAWTREEGDRSGLVYTRVKLD